LLSFFSVKGQGLPAAAELPTVAAHCRGSRLRAWDRHLPRDGQKVGQPVRADVRREDPHQAGGDNAPAHPWRWRLDEVYVRVQGQMRHLCVGRSALNQWVCY